MSLETDFVVIGSGVAGLRAAIEIAGSGAHVSVLTKDKTSESNSEYAQGGVAVVLSDDDKAELHEGDTLVAGAGLCDEMAVEVLVAEGTKYIKQLIDWGTEFDRDGGRLGGGETAGGAGRQSDAPNAQADPGEHGAESVCWRRGGEAGRGRFA